MGGAIVDAATELRKFEGEIDRAICGIVRETGGKEYLNVIGRDLVGLLKKSESDKAAN